MLAQGQLTDSPLQILKVLEKDSKIQAKAFIFYNNDPSDIDIFLHFVPNVDGFVGIPDNTNRISLTTPPGKTIVFSLGYPIEYSNENDAIFASAAVTDKVNYFVLGVRN